MHEPAITEALLEQVCGFMPRRGRLAEVRIEIGALEHIQPEVMATVWEVLTKDTAFAGSRLLAVNLLVVIAAPQYWQ